jgi:adenylosuccinate synthase
MKTENLQEFLKAKKIVAVVCNQWGDTGKGKLVDLLSSWADIIVRGTGGANAGHSIKVGEQEHVFHLIPSGILHDSDGKINILGRGVAFDPRVVIEELDLLAQNNIFVKHLKISHQAPLMLPYHLLIDRLADINAKVGTTGRGIGPLYTDFISRQSLFVNDIFNPDIFKAKLEKFLANKKNILAGLDKDLAKQVLLHPHLGSGLFFDEQNILSVDKIVEKYSEYALKLKDFVINLELFLNQAKLENKNILLEGAQGALLSIDYGTTKFQTSSDCTLAGLAKGCGLMESEVDYVFGIAKAFYMTRVGNGPFPTELGAKTSEDYCASGHSKEEEKENYASKIPALLEADDFSQGIAFRLLGHEYGATTGRPRRTGWLDLVALKYAMQFNGKNLSLTKIDVLTGIEKIKLCVKYKYTGPEIFYAGKILHTDEELDYFIPDSDILYACKPLYQEFSGWTEDLTQIEDYQALPDNVKTLVEFIENYTGGQVDLISVGPDREETIIKI